MKYYAFLSFFLLFVLGTVNAKSQGEVVYVSAESVHDVRDSRFYFMWGNGSVNTAGSSQPILFSSEGSTESGVLQFESSSFVLNGNSSVDFDGRFRFVVHSSSKDEVKGRESCTKNGVSSSGRCDFLMFKVDLLEVSTGNVLAVVEGKTIEAELGQLLDTVSGGRYSIDIGSLVQEQRNMEGLSVQLRLTIVTGSSLFRNYRSGFSSSGFDGLFDLN